ncbi:hypothetical protein GCM10027043_02110 [Ferruginibacter profundus]
MKNAMVKTNKYNFIEVLIFLIIASSFDLGKAGKLVAVQPISLEHIQYECTIAAS